MTLFQAFVVLCWFSFIVVWFIASRGAKRTVHHVGSGILIRIAFVILIAVAAHYLVATHVITIRPFASPFPLGAVLLGDFLVAAGVAFAIWARVYLGRNWGMPMSVKENPELVTSGPYAYVRHPIYTGMIVATFGSGLVTPWWFIFFVVCVIYFAYAATREEALMQKTFPDAYPAYKARTKMLIPFVL